MHTTSALPRYSMYQKMRTKLPKICQRSTWTLAKKIGRCHSLAMSQHLDAYVLSAHWTWPVVHPVVPLVFWTEARLTVPIPHRSYMALSFRDTSETVLRCTFQSEEPLSPWPVRELYSAQSAYSAWAPLPCRLPCLGTLRGVLFSPTQFSARTTWKVVARTRRMPGPLRRDLPGKEW